MIRINSTDQSPNNSKPIQQFFENPAFQFSQMKTTRAIDRIFSQNQIQKVHDIYQQIQQDKRANTTKLRNTLQKNYDKMLDCSELLDRVHEYADKIKAIANQISNHIVEGDDEGALNKKGGGGKYKIKYNHKKGKNSDQSSNEKGDEVLKIQQNLRKSEFSLAIQIIYKNMQIPITQTPLSKSEYQYLSYLQVQILMKLQQKLSNCRLSINNLTDAINCVVMFLKIENSGSTLKDTISRLQQKYKGCPNSSLFQMVLTSLSYNIDSCSQSNESEIILQTAIQTILEYKISLLVCQCDHNEMQNFQNYFQDLLKIIQHPKQLNSQTSNNKQIIALLAGTIDAKVPQIKTDLAKIFIYKNQRGEITFRSALYDKLMASSKFSSTLQQIKQQLHQQQSALEFFKELWKNYLIILVDYCSDEVNPKLYIQKLIKYHNEQTLKRSIPPQIQIYIIDRSPQESSRILQQYSGKLEIVGLNLLFALERSNNSEKQLIKSKFTEKWGSLLKDIEELRELHLQNSQELKLSFRVYIMLKLILSVLDQKLAQISEKHVVMEGWQSLGEALKNIEIDKFWQIFQKHEKCYLHSNTVFEQQMNSFDAFFMGYIENSTFKNQQNIKATLIQIILSFLQQITHHFPQSIKKLEILQHTRQSLKQRKQRMTIMDYIVLPYIAKIIFECEFKEFKMDENKLKKHNSEVTSLYELYFRKVPTKTNDIPDQPEGDEFEIGDKQEAEEVVKVNKSMFSIGNNLIAGLMPKKK